MKILIYGAGIVGSTYGWQLSEASCDVTLLVRKGQKELVEANGIQIHCADFRGGQKHIVRTIFRPNVVDDLLPQNDYDIVIVCVNNTQLSQVLPTLGKSAGKSDILFFQNNWDHFDEIGEYLAPERYFFGFPFMTGGGRDEKGINSVISGLKYSSTLLGEVSGVVSPRIQRMADVLAKANLKPVISKQIVTWLVSHYVVAAGLSAGTIKAGGAVHLTGSTKMMKETIKAIKEGFEVCLRRGINPKLEKANKLYYLPLFISVPIAKKVFSSEMLRLMFDGHTQHSPDEMKKMLCDITDYGEKYGVDTPFLKQFKESMAI